jgi:predicted NBD/HSP70 family sugar kinase/biotin operon repressor
MSAPNAGSPLAAGYLLELIRGSRARTRRELQELTGLSRSTIASRIDQLVEAGYVHESGVEHGRRGRPSTTLAFDENHGVILAADLGATHARAAICDLGGRVLTDHAQNLKISKGPDRVIGWLENRWKQLLDTAGLKGSRVLGVGASVPGPVDVATGRPVQPPIMPGWHDYPVRERLEQAFNVPGLIENDANAMAFGEYHSRRPTCSSMLFIKAATGIGAGMVIDGHLLRGLHGGSGDIGHVRLPEPHAEALCACGARGCLAASASGGAIARELREAGRRAPTSRAAVRLAQSGDPYAVSCVREAGLLLGDVLATAVSLVNPQILMIGGDLAQAQEHFMVAVRERLYQRTQSLATRDLQILTSSLGDEAGVVGIAHLVVEQLFDADAVDNRLSSERSSPRPDGIMQRPHPREQSR